MPEFDFNEPGPGGLFVPKDPKREAKDRVIEALRLTVRMLADGGITPLANAALTQALAPEVFRLIYHEGLVE